MMSSKLRSQSILNDLSSFETTTTPTKVVKALKYVNSQHSKFNSKLFNASLKLAFNHVSGDTEDSERIYERIQEKCESSYDLMILYSHLITITTFAAHQHSLSVKKELFHKKIKDLGTSAELCDKITELLYESERPCKRQTDLTNLEEMRWRVYVAISTSSLNRVLEPTIVMDMKTSDGKTQTFEISMSKFHELRYGVSSLLKEMEAISKR